MRSQKRPKRVAEPFCSKVFLACFGGVLLVPFPCFSFFWFAYGVFGGLASNKALWD